MTKPTDEIMLTRLSALLVDVACLKLSEVRPPTKKKDADGEWIN